MKTPESPEESEVSVPARSKPMSKVRAEVESALSEDAEKVRRDIVAIHALVAERTKEFNSLAEGVSSEGDARAVLDGFLDGIGLEKTPETRYVAYVRLANLREDALKNHLESAGLDQSEKDAVLARAFESAEAFHMAKHEAVLEKIESRGLLTPFYRAVLRGTHRTGIAFNRFQKAWTAYLLNGVNRELEERFDGDQKAVMDYLAENKLFDRGHGIEIADRSYSVLKKPGDGYERLAYARAFPEEIKAISDAISDFFKDIRGLRDDAFGQRDAYVMYLTALNDAISETRCDGLVSKWAVVDIAWMSVTSPFQIGHPLEYYEDKFRKAVAPEWDLRLKNETLFASEAKESVEAAFDSIAAEKGLTEKSQAYSFSKGSLNRTQLYVSAPLFYYGACLTGLPSAQVVPNDADVSKKYGKKIFSFAENVLKRLRAQPKMKLARLTIEESLRKKREGVIFWKDADFYRLYDIETIGHEFGHTLWLELDTEPKMNGSGNFKNVEEWKATTGGLVAFFLNPKEELKEDVVVDLVMRSVGLIGWMKEEDAVPYYCEALVHLKLLFDSGVVFLNAENKIALNLTDGTYDALKSAYLSAYSDLADEYLAKRDASGFLDRYSVREKSVFLPKDPTVRTFVESYYALYEKFGNSVDDEA